MFKLMFQCRWLLVLVCVSATHAGELAVLVGPDLKKQNVELQSIQQNVVRYFDQNRSLQQQPIEKLLQIRFATHARSERSEGRDQTSGLHITLIDGQRIIGNWHRVQDAGQTLVVTHPQAGELSLPLDQIRQLSWSAAKMDTDDRAGKDTVITQNGDTLVGFVTALTTTGIELQLEDQNETVKLASNQLSHVSLVNAQVDNGQRQHRIHLADGNRWQTDALSVVSGKLTFTPASGQEPVTLTLDMVTLIDLAHQDGQLVSLAELPWQTVAGGTVFTVPIPPRVQADALYLHAPIQLAYDLPAGKKVFAGEISLQTIGDQRVGDCIVILRDGPKVLMQERLYANRPQVQLGAAITGTTFSIEIDPGNQGPVRDFVVIRDAMIYVAGRE